MSTPSNFIKTTSLLVRYKRLVMDDMNIYDMNNKNLPSITHHNTILHCNALWSHYYATTIRRWLRKVIHDYATRLCWVKYTTLSIRHYPSASVFHKYATKPQGWKRTPEQKQLQRTTLQNIRTEANFQNRRDCHLSTYSTTFYATKHLVGHPQRIRVFVIHRRSPEVLQRVLRELKKITRKRQTINFLVTCKSCSYFTSAKVGKYWNITKQNIPTPIVERREAKMS